jgi:hypothetical protein
MCVACSLALLFFLFVFYLHSSTLVVAIKGATSFSSQRKSVVYHPNTSRLADIGMVLALVG